MLVFISDLHLSDGTTGTNIHPGAFHIFAERLRYLAARASWRKDGVYRPIDRIDLVLLGDTFDLVRSQRWLQTDVRPWDDPANPAVAATVAAILDGILAKNEASLALLQGLATQGTVCVAPASRAGQPVYGAPPQAIPVRTYYMVGNHDWMLHLPGRSYDDLRHKVGHRLALANPLDEPFPHDPTESNILRETLMRHRVVARHGDVFDPLNFTEDRNASSLGDAITIQLIMRFANELRRELGQDIAAPLSLGLKELDHVRPLLLAPVWIEGLIVRTCPTPALRKHIKQTWDWLADELLQSEMVRQFDSCSPFELVDGLERALKFSKRRTTDWAAKIAAWSYGLRGAQGPSYCEHALSEPDFRNRRARHIVYGHTHHAESIPLDASHADRRVLNQLYFNCGSWRRVYQPTQMAASEHEFIPLEQMTFLSLFEGDERGGRPFETWTGMLGVGSQEHVFSQHTAAATQASPPPISSRRNQVPAPHFGGVAQSTRSFG